MYETLTTRPTVPVTVVLVAFLAVGLAGCIGGGGNEAGPRDDDTGDSDVTDPTNVTPNDTNNSSIVWNKTTPIDENSTLHTHDYWRGGDSYTIMDEHTVPGFSPEFVANSCIRLNACPPRGVRTVNIPIDTEAEQPKFVYPGTGKMTVELSWTGSNSQDITPVVCLLNNGRSPANDCLQHDSSGSSSLNGSHEFSEPGEVWTIEDDRTFSTQTWDVPHTFKSKWRFAILADNCPPGGGPTASTCMPAIDIDQFTMTVKIFRGEQNLPIDPPHFDYYQDRDELPILNETALEGPGVYPGNGCTGTLNMRTTASWREEQVNDEELEICRFDGILFRKRYLDGDSAAPVIPPGTSQVRVNLRWETENPSAAPMGLTLRYHDAITNWGADWIEPSDSTCEANSCEYVIPVTEKQSDSLYARRSVWEFAVFWGEDPQPPGVNMNVYASVTAEASAA